MHPLRCWPRLSIFDKLLPADGDSDPRLKFSTAYIRWPVARSVPFSFGLTTLFGWLVSRISFHRYSSAVSRPRITAGSSLVIGTGISLLARDLNVKRGWCGQLIALGKSTRCYSSLRLHSLPFFGDILSNSLREAWPGATGTTAGLAGGNCGERGKLSLHFVWMNTDEIEVEVFEYESLGCAGALFIELFLQSPAPSVLRADELSWPALHCLFISAACAREVRRQSNQFFYMSVCVVPELDAKRKILLRRQS